MTYSFVVPVEGMIWVQLYGFVYAFYGIIEAALVKEADALVVPGSNVL
jgi:hypothetical protein